MKIPVAHAFVRLLSLVDVDVKKKNNNNKKILKK